MSNPNPNPETDAAVAALIERHKAAINECQDVQLIGLPPENDFRVTRSLMASIITTAFLSGALAEQQNPTT
jgi:hypothetical protein